MCPRLALPTCRLNQRMTLMHFIDVIGPGRRALIEHAVAVKRPVFDTPKPVEDGGRI